MQEFGRCRKLHKDSVFSYCLHEAGQGKLHKTLQRMAECGTMLQVIKCQRSKTAILVEAIE